MRGKGRSKWLERERRLEWRGRESRWWREIVMGPGVTSHATGTCISVVFAITLVCKIGHNTEDKAHDDGK